MPASGVPNRPDVVSRQILRSLLTFGFRRRFLDHGIVPARRQILCDPLQNGDCAILIQARTQKQEWTNCQQLEQLRQWQREIDGTIRISVILTVFRQRQHAVFTVLPIAVNL